MFSPSFYNFHTLLSGTLYEVRPCLLQVSPGYTHNIVPIKKYKKKYLFSWLHVGETVEEIIWKQTKKREKIVFFFTNLCFLKTRWVAAHLPTAALGEHKISVKAKSGSVINKNYILQLKSFDAAASYDQMIRKLLSIEDSAATQYTDGRLHLHTFICRICEDLHNSLFTVMHAYLSWYLWSVMNSLKQTHS